MIDSTEVDTTARDDTQRKGRRTRYGTGLVYLPKGRTTWVMVFWHRGKRYHRTTGATTERAAGRVLLRQLKELGRGAPPSTASRRAKFEDIVALLTADYRTKGNKSLDRALLCVRHLQAHFGDKSPRDVDFTAVQAYINARLDQGAALATVKQERAILGRMMRLALAAKLLDARPELPTMGDPKNARTGFLSEADFNAIRDELPEALRPVAEFMFLTGWRKREVLGLTWARVDFQAGTVTLEPSATKGGERRMFPFSVLPDLAALLRRQREATSALERETGSIVPHVFHRRGKPIRSFHEAWANARERAGRPWALVHDFRRGAARRLERAGVARSQSMRLLGLRTGAIFTRYAIAPDDDLHEAVTKMAARLAADRMHDDSPATIGPANTVHTPSTVDTSSGEQRRALRA